MLILLLILVSVTVGLLIYFYQYMNSIMDSGELTTTYDYHYAFIADPSDSFMRQVYNAASEELSSQNAYLEFMGENIDSSYSTSDLMDIAIASGVDGIIVDPSQDGDLTDKINEATSEGIPVICVGGDCYGSSRAGYIGMTYFKLGQMIAENFTQNAVSTADPDGVVSVEVLTYTTKNATNQNLTLSGIRSYLSDNHLFSQFDVTTRSISEDSQFSVVESVNSLFESQTLPDILVCLDETSTTCVCQAVVDANQVGKVSIYGCYTNDTIVHALKQNIISAVFTVSPEEIGRAAADSMTAYITDGFTSEYSSIDITTVTADNASDFENTVEETEDGDEETS